VSSLVHSSTLVTAGVYLTLRFYYSINFLKYSFLLINISLITCLLSGIVACTETDFKKVVAMSTLSQLGLIIYCISILEIKCGFFHIVCHAIFKALLFLSCGLLIKLAIGSQDSRFKGGLSFITIFINTLFLLSRIRLLGFPFLTGFYSKDRILEYTIINEINIFILMVVIICCILTFIYSMRLFFVGIKIY
jgi:NADH-ubiquinone oxidoreductase chain 5